MEMLLLFHDFISPYCRVALDAAREAAEAVEAELRLVPFELVPAPSDLPAAGDPAIMGEIEAAAPIARERGLSLDVPRTLPRTRKAHEAVAFAGAHELEVPLAAALYQALWRDGADLGRLDVLAELGAGVGLDRDALHVALGLDEHAEVVTRAQRAAEEAGVTGVPTFSLGASTQVGLVRARELVEWARDALNMDETET